MAPYIPTSIKIELGARSDHYPVESAEVLPYVEQAIPGSLSAPSTTVRVLGITRTFWEKATILHMIHHQGPEKLRPRMARHYYDFYQISKSEYYEEAVADTAPKENK